MWFKYFSKTLILLPVFLIGCVGVYSVDETAPTGDFDIVFQTEMDGYDNLGFYSLTTKDSTELKTKRGLTSPYVLSDGNLVALWNNASVNPRGVAGYLTILRQTPEETAENYGEPRTIFGRITDLRQKSQGLFCKIDDFYSNLIRPKGNELILNSIITNTLNIVEPKDCKFVNELLNLSDIGISKENHQRIQAFSVNTNSNTLVLSAEDRNLRTFNLMRVNLSTKEVVDFKKFGINPSISPNGKEIAYLSEDGIRIMDIEGKDILKITDDIPWRRGEQYSRDYGWPNAAKDTGDLRPSTKRHRPVGEVVEVQVFNQYQEAGRLADGPGAALPAARIGVGHTLFRRLP